MARDSGMTQAQVVSRLIGMVGRVREIDRMKVWDFTYKHEPTVQMAKEDPEGYWVRHSDLTAAIGLNTAKAGNEGEG